MSCWPVLAVSILLLLFAQARAQTASQTQAALGEKRWLVILETSEPMTAKKEGALTALQALVDSGMNGQAAEGDTIGFWAFNDALRTGLVPLQRWSRKSAASIAQRATQFVTSQRYEKEPAFAVLAEPLEKVVSGSDVLTVILISSGRGSLQGTPYDDSISAQWREFRNERSTKPIVTVIRGVQGSWKEFKITPGEFATEIPQLPQSLSKSEPPPVAKATPQKRKAPSGVKKPPVAAALSNQVPGALIFSGPNKPDLDAKQLAPSKGTNIPVPPPTAPPAAAASEHNAVPVQVLTNEAQKALAGQPPASALSNAPAPTMNPSEEISQKPAVAALEPAIQTNQTAKANTNITAEVSPELAHAPAQPRHYPWIWIVSGLASLLLVVAGLVLRRKSRRHVSLITESIDQERR